ncbi:MAG TPA: glycosyltransferase family 1 protein, partial [Candidatus Saccharimonadales bacterium]|nr:glycosyltransferase family 1 protein [Candidatus Saccharimonadales bacterium]
MIIGIDGNEANVERRVGISEYAFELLLQFKSSQKEHITFQIYLKDIPLPHMPKESANWHYILVKPRKFWTQLGLPLYLFTHRRPDVFFTPSHYAPRFSPVPTAIAIMDVAYLKFPELFASKDLYQLREWTKYSAHNAKKIFTISESSKNDIIKEYQAKPGNVIVTYPGIKENSRGETMFLSKKHMDELKKKFTISENYILFVGTLQPRKNITKLIESFSEVLKKSKKKDLELVIVGKKGWQYEEILEAPEKFGVSDNVKFLDFVSDEDLPSLYKHALCYVLPSLYEGFGLPVLEAMKYDCPVITSNVSSMPEAGGDAALYVDPTDVADITEKIVTLIDNEKLRQELIGKGQKQIKKFSWEKTAKETL